jgi:hypothetical protein
MKSEALLFFNLVMNGKFFVTGEFQEVAFSAGGSLCMFSVIANICIGFGFFVLLWGWN